ncbi:unnamed protein product [Meganyctiphanes norvegica]|uniref:Uncharacterized protein n=1 Tax=Meganyctiphanes norvegica TaxID=48144 RepID=A0AAV2R4L5_MEGNR
MASLNDLTFSPKYLKEVEPLLPILNLFVISSITCDLNLSIPHHRKSSICTTTIPSRTSCTCQKNRELSTDHFVTPKARSSKLTLSYHSLAASHSPSTVLFSCQSEPSSNSLGGLRNTNLDIVFPCKYAACTSTVWHFHPQDDANLLKV